MYGVQLKEKLHFYAKVGEIGWFPKGYRAI
jgi:hypothetical protein